MSRQQFIATAIKDVISRKGYDHQELKGEITAAITEAWDHLVKTRQILLDEKFAGAEVYKIGPKGREALKAARRNHAEGTWKLVKESLHSKLRQDVWNAYARCEYETAVFNAMKAVEVAVRDAAGLNEQQWTNIVEFIRKPTEIAKSLGCEWPASKGRWEGLKGYRAQMEAAHAIMAKIAH